MTKLGHPKIIICFLFTARVGEGPTGTFFFMFLEEKKFFLFLSVYPSQWEKKKGKKI